MPLDAVKMNRVTLTFDDAGLEGEFVGEYADSVRLQQRYVWLLVGAMVLSQTAIDPPSEVGFCSRVVRCTLLPFPLVMGVAVTFARPALFRRAWAAIAGFAASLLLSSVPVTITVKGKGELATWLVRGAKATSALAIVGVLAGCTKGGPTTGAQSWSSPPPMQIDTTQPYSADLVTDSGSIHIELFASADPRTVNNFVFLARQHFYDGTIFHRVIVNFMIQGGDPTGTGMGGPGYTFDDELPPKVPYAAGVVCMANSGPNTNGSQFFICTGDGCASLPPDYTELGTVTSGADVVTAIASAPVGPSSSGEMSAPKVPVHVQSVTITGP